MKILIKAIVRSHLHDKGVPNYYAGTGRPESKPKQDSGVRSGMSGLLIQSRIMRLTRRYEPYALVILAMVESATINTELSPIQTGERWGRNVMCVYFTATFFRRSWPTALCTRQKAPVIYNTSDSGQFWRSLGKESDGLYLPLDTKQEAMTVKTAISWKSAHMIWCPE